MYAPHTVTVYSITEDAVTFEIVNNITVLRGVFVDQSQATNIQKSGLANADSVMVYIPFSVDSGVKTFLGEKEYEKSAEPMKHWTLRPGKDFFICGEVVEPGKTKDQLEAVYDGVYQITTVDTKNFGSAAMQHWEVGGR